LNCKSVSIFDLKRYTRKSNLYSILRCFIFKYIAMWPGRLNVHKARGHDPQGNIEFTLEAIAESPIDAPFIIHPSTLAYAKDNPSNETHITTFALSNTLDKSQSIDDAKDMDFLLKQSPLVGITLDFQQDRPFDYLAQLYMLAMAAKYSAMRELMQLPRVVLLQSMVWIDTAKGLSTHFAPSDGLVHYLGAVIYKEENAVMLLLRLSRIYNQENVPIFDVHKVVAHDNELSTWDNVKGLVYELMVITQDESSKMFTDHWDLASTFEAGATWVPEFSPPAHNASTQSHAYCQQALAILKEYFNHPDWDFVVYHTSKAVANLKEPLSKLEKQGYIMRDGNRTELPYPPQDAPLLIMTAVLDACILGRMGPKEMVQFVAKYRDEDAENDLEA